MWEVITQVYRSADWKISIIKDTIKTMKLRLIKEEKEAFEAVVLNVNRNRMFAESKGLKRGAEYAKYTYT